jgi:hypothetical protein
LSPKHQLVIKSLPANGRWRAARFLKLEYVPAIVKETNPQQMLEMLLLKMFNVKI